MEIRGERECKNCGARWSYYDTGSVACPECESLHSVGVDDDRKLHTANRVELDLTEAVSQLDEVPEDEALSTVKSTCREFQRKHGFVHAGELRDLDDTYLVAGELLQVADMVGRSLGRDDDEEFYLLSLLRGDEADRPAPDEVPESLREGRGLAYAEAVREYRRELREWADASDVTIDRPATEVLSSIDEHAKRIRALEGDVPAREAERLVTVLREVTRYVRDDDEAALAQAQNRLSGLDEN
ncbi:TFIIB-type zinc ribbon-containing protein [Haloarchaeobius sp. HME9146]|uniref:DUF7117 family protein n=1 Tax=Haloarchaeobius sp. HME9146 TaxID=2978732 RepID=UPI0021C1D85E|nr:TFIIB-type zinc ribbon-containing protein [Haloarchaeobius sp. HME9146]MCT9097388.1 TFIIB-type zinc ribbon-containing protein [Haloarchaeobius sp. HME9146]